MHEFHPFRLDSEKMLLFKDDLRLEVEERVVQLGLMDMVSQMLDGKLQIANQYLQIALLQQADFNWARDASSDPAPKIEHSLRPGKRPLAKNRFLS